jgi:hypothetical protein
MAEADGVGDWLVRLLPCAAVGLALIVFAGALGYPFVDDDRLMVVNNPVLRSWTQVPQYFVEDAWGHSGPDAMSNYYRPAQLLWLRLNYAWFDMSPGGYHAASIALHALATALVFLVARRTLRDRLAAGFAALIFAVHPIHVEPAVWISGATESELAVFFLTAVLCYVVWRECMYSAAKSARWWLGFSLLAYALALLTKESAVLLGAMFVIYEWKWRPAGGRQDADGNRPMKPENPSEAQTAERIVDDQRSLVTRIASRMLRVVLVLWPYGVVVAAYLAARSYALRASPRAGSGASLTTILLTLPQVFVFDLRKLLWPFPLSLFYPLQMVTRPHLANFVVPLAVSLAALAGLWIWSRRSEAVGWAWCGS